MSNVHQQVINYSFYVESNVVFFSSGKLKPIELFEEANFGRQILSNIRRAHFEELTAIQRYTIPCIRQQDDMMACAQNGSGKTVRFRIQFSFLFVNHITVVGSISSANHIKLTFVSCG